MTHRAPEPLGDGLAEVGLGLEDRVVLLGFGELGFGEPGSGEPGSGEPGSGEPGSGEPVLGDSELGHGDSKAEMALGLAVVLGECGAALWMIGPQPVSATMVVDRTIAGQICFGSTSKLLQLFETPT